MRIHTKQGLYDVSVVNHWWNINLWIYRNAGKVSRVYGLTSLIPHRLKVFLVNLQNK